LAKHSRFCHTCCFRIWGSSSHHLACLPQFSIYLCSKTCPLNPQLQIYLVPWFKKRTERTHKTSRSKNDRTTHISITSDERS
jgi:hypothetical protein